MAEPGDGAGACWPCLGGVHCWPPPGPCGPVPSCSCGNLPSRWPGPRPWVLPSCSNRTRRSPSPRSPSWWPTRMPEPNRPSARTRPAATRARMPSGRVNHAPLAGGGAAGPYGPPGPTGAPGLGRPRSPGCCCGLGWRDGCGRGGVDGGRRWPSGVARRRRTGTGGVAHGSRVPQRDRGNGPGTASAGHLTPDPYPSLTSAPGRALCIQPFAVRGRPGSGMVVPCHPVGGDGQGVRRRSCRCSQGSGRPPGRWWRRRW